VGQRSDGADQATGLQIRLGLIPISGVLTHGGEAVPGSTRRPDPASGWPKEAGSGGTATRFSGGGCLRALGPAAMHGVAEAAWWVGW
jgi:hypothetical protein